MKVSFCQTYGDRRELLKIRFNDKKLIDFYSNFDINIFSFHNSPREVIDWFKENNNIPNLKIFINNDISYTGCIERLRRTLKALNATHYFFHQDDTFSFNNSNVDLNKLYHYATNQQDIMLNLSFKESDFESDLQSIFSEETFNIFANDTYTFSREAPGGWSMDDSPYIASVNYFDKVYDNVYIHYADVWASEQYLNSKFSKVNIKRNVTNLQLFKNYNILGKNNQNKKQEYKWLEERNLICT